MVKHERVSHKNEDGVEQKHDPSQRESKPSSYPIPVWDEGYISIGDTPFQPQVEKHTLLMSMAHSDEQRANITLQLQQNYGNRYVQRLLQSMSMQAKMTVNPPSDIYELEADKVADMVTKGVRSQPQRQEEEEVMTKPSSEIQLQPKEKGKGKKPAPKKGGAGAMYYSLVLKPLLEGLWDQLSRKVNEHRYHLLALACLRKAAGPGGDPIEVARFCKKYKLPLTLPVVGLISRTIGKLDITGATKLGVKIIAAMLPLLTKIRMNNAMLYALDESIVPSSDTTDVGEILESAKSPKDVADKAKQKASEVKKLKADIERYVVKLKGIEAELGVKR